jgi:DNA-binding NarL/FixJ family response regulator
MSVRVLLVDDQELVRTGFRAILAAQPGIEVVAEAGDGAAALAAVAEHDPDVVCMDVQMPGMDGLAATRELVAAGARAAVLVLTTFDRDDYLFEALDAGASGFLLKTSGPEQLVEAVRVLAAGDALLSPAVTRRVIERFGAESGRGDAGAGDAFGAGAASGAGGASEPGGASAASDAAPACTDPAFDELTERESEVLGLVASGLSNAEIAARLVLGEATVKTHVSNVLLKLGVRDRVQAVVRAYRSGFARAD